MQRPHPAVHVGGESDAALRRAVEHGQGWIARNRDELLRSLDALRAQTTPA